MAFAIPPSPLPATPEPPADAAAGNTAHAGETPASACVPLARAAPECVLDPALAPAPALVPGVAPTAAECAEPRADAAETERLGNDIAELAARIQAATYELLVLVRRFDEQGGWSGFVSCAHWLNWRTGLALGPAREKVRVARALAALPLLSEAMRHGRISYSKVRALTRVARPDNERRLLDFALCAPASYVERMTRAWRRTDRQAEADDDRRRHAGRELRTWVDDDGMVLVRGRLTPEVGAVVRRALEAAVDRQRSEEPADVDPATADGGPETTFGQRQADALGLLAESALAADLDRGTAGDRYQVVLHVDADTLRADAEAGAGDVPAETRPVGAATPAAGSGAQAVDAGDVSAEMRPVAAAAREDSAEARPDSAAPPAAGSGVQAVDAGDVSAETRPVGVAAREDSAEARPDGAVTPAAESGGQAFDVGDVSAETRPVGAGGATVDADDVSAETRPDGAAPLAVDARDVPAETSGAAGAPGCDVPAKTRRRGHAALEDADGLRVSAETARRMACDASPVVLRHAADGAILDVGRKTRTIPPALGRALRARDRGCRFPGCTARRCDAHHVEHWADGGRTALDNLVLLCRRHHRAVHEEGFRVELDAGGEVAFRWPDGRPLPPAPAAPRWTGPPLAPTDARLTAAGIDIGPATATPHWHGERLDLGYAIDVLWTPPPGRAATPGGPA